MYVRRAFLTTKTWGVGSRAPPLGQGTQQLVRDLGPTAQRILSQILAKCLSSTNKKSYVNNYNNSNQVSF